MTDIPQDSQHQQEETTTNSELHQQVTWQAILAQEAAMDDTHEQFLQSMSQEKNNDQHHQHPHEISTGEIPDFTSVSGDEGPMPEQAPTPMTRNRRQVRTSDASKTKLSMTSQQYDRGHKGYLDDTEKKIRQLDTDNLGYVDIHKVYALMQDFQSEQKKSLTLKWVVISLSGFAILLCLANIGTSFAAATLAKDVTTTPTFGILTDKYTGQGLSTGNKEPWFDLVEDVNGTATRPLDPTSNGTSRLLKRRYHTPRGLHSHVTHGDATDRTRQLAIQEYDTLKSMQNGQVLISQDMVNNVMHSLCGTWDQKNGIANFGCNGIRNCGPSADRVRLMLPNGCGKAEIEYATAPTCWDSGTYEIQLGKVVVSETADWYRQCQDDYGRDATVVDWEDIVRLYDTSQEVEAFMGRLGIQKESNVANHYFLTNDGYKIQRKTSNPQRAYFMEYTDQSSSNSVVHEEFLGMTLSSGYDIGGRVLCLAPIDHVEILFHFETRVTKQRSTSVPVTIYCNGDDSNEDCSVYGLSC